jgi:two-component system OmpR family sensor kinase
MRSIKSDLTRDWLIISCLLVSSVVIAIYGFTQARARNVLDRQLQQFAHLMVVHDLVGDSAIDDDQEPVLPRNLMVRQWRIGAAVGYVSHPEQFKIPFDLPEGFSTVGINTAGNSSHLRVYTLKSGKSMIQVAAPLTERDMLSRELAEALILPVIAILLLFMGIFRWRMRRALAPLRLLDQDITQQKNSWKEGLDENKQPLELAAPVQAINQLVRQLLKNLELQQHFIADAAHELRTPLTALRLQLGNLQQSLNLEQQQASAEALSEMQRGIVRATRLVEQLLQLARLQHHSQSYQTEGVDIVPLIHKTLIDMAAPAAAAHIELAYEGPDHALVQAFPFALRILLENLLQNAFKYGQTGSLVQVCLEQMPKAEDTEFTPLPNAATAGEAKPVTKANPSSPHGLPPRYALSNDALLQSTPAQELSQAGNEHALPASLPAGTWLLSVKNEGDGIEAEWYPRVFERFFRMSEHQNLPGSGLGLPIVREIARLHGGEVFLAPLHEDAAQPGLLIGVTLNGADSAQI